MLQFICFYALSFADCFLLADTTSGDLENPELCRTAARI